ncbi:MAG TPA: phosphotransferase [Myxococcales bacterium]|nr:phosphotransferase [Myxococcales bacterium]
METLGEIRALLASLLPGAELESAVPLSADSGTGETQKAVGYVEPLLLTVTQDGARRRLVLRFGKPDEFGHRRRSDRVQRFLLAFDTAHTLPRHAEVLDVGAVDQGDVLRSLRGCGEPYLLSEFAAGDPYAADLRRVAETGRATSLDLSRSEALARYLAQLHALRLTADALYRRTVRDLLGHGEGVFGIVDGYPEGVPAAPPERLQRLERACWEWRWRLRGRDARFARIHGDFHPFNVLFREATDFTVIGAARGSAGDPADDVTALAINYLFFALEKRGEAWDEGLGPLWRSFWATYLDESGDGALLGVAAPFLAWRALVLANPRFYPRLAERDRDALLAFVEDVLAEDSFDPGAAEALF